MFAAQNAEVVSVCKTSRFVCAVRGQETVLIQVKPPSTANKSFPLEKFSWYIKSGLRSDTGCTVVLMHLIETLTSL